MATRSSIQKGVDAILGKTTIVTDTGTTTSNNPNNTPEKQTSDKTVEDMKMTGRADVSKFKVSIGDYLKDKGELSKAGAILEDIAKDEKTKLNILVLIALSRWQTRDGTTIAVKKKHNPGCITGMSENEKLADLKSGYETMVKQLTSKLTENDGEWLSSTRLWYVTKLMTKDDAAGLEADDVKQMGAEEDKEGTSKSGGLSGSDTYDLPTQGPSITEQVSRLKPGWSSALPIIGGILKQNNLADGAQISSAARTPVHNASVNGAENSYHIDNGDGGDAVDIVLPDETTQSQADNIIEVFKNTKAFAEVLFHDVGSGFHLHLGGYGGAISGVSIKLEKQQMFWYDKLRTYVNDVYDKLLGEKPPWEKRILKKKDQQAKGRSSDKGVKTISKVPHGKHGEDDPDSVLVVLPRNETFSEPVYPDLLTVADNVPQYIKTLSRVVKPPQDIGVFDLVTNPGKVADLYQEGIAKAVVIAKEKITGTTDSGEETPPQPVFTTTPRKCAWKGFGPMTSSGNISPGTTFSSPKLKKIFLKASLTS